MAEPLLAAGPCLPSQTLLLPPPGASPFALPFADAFHLAFSYSLLLMPQALHLSSAVLQPMPCCVPFSSAAASLLPCLVCLPSCLLCFPSACLSTCPSIRLSICVSVCVLVQKQLVCLNAAWRDQTSMRCLRAVQGTALPGLAWRKLPLLLQLVPMSCQSPGAGTPPFPSSSSYQSTSAQSLHPSPSKSSSPAPSGRDIIPPPPPQCASLCSLNPIPWYPPFGPRLLPAPPMQP